MDAQNSQERGPFVRRPVSPHHPSGTNFRAAFELTPGPELDRFVHRIIVGGGIDEVPEYSIDPAAAFALEEVMASGGWYLSLDRRYDDKMFRADFCHRDDWYVLELEVCCASAAEAVVKAAILAKSIRESNDDRFRELESVVWLKDTKRGRRWTIDSSPFYWLDEINYYVTHHSGCSGIIIPASELAEIKRCPRISGDRRQRKDTKDGQ